MTNARLLLITGIFLMIFGIDGILLLDSSIPECSGFTGMALFVFVTLGFDSRAILSNPDCLESFAGQIISGILFVTGISMTIHVIFKKQTLFQNSQRITK